MMVICTNKSYKYETASVLLHGPQTSDEGEDDDSSTNGDHHVGGDGEQLDTQQTDVVVTQEVGR